MASNKEPLSPDGIAQKLDSMRPDGTFDRPLEQQDVTNVLQMALERVRIAQMETHLAIQASTERLVLETEATRELVRSLTPPKDV